MKKLQDKVKYCLENFPDTTNSDVLLTIQVWRTFYPDHIKGKNGREGVYLDSLYDLPREDNIKRIRAQFNSDGLYLPTSEKVAKQRRLNISEWRKLMGYDIDIPKAKLF